MTGTPRPGPGRTLTTPTPDLRQDPDMDMRCPRAWLHPSHRWINTDSNGYLCDGMPEGAPPELRATDKHPTLGINLETEAQEGRPEPTPSLHAFTMTGYGYGMPPTRTESVAVTLGAENVRHAFTTTPEREPEGSRTAPQQLARFLSERAVGVSPRGEFRWAGTPGDHGYLTEAEVRTLTALFVQLAQEMTQGPESQNCQVCGLAFVNSSCPSCGVTA